jgi:hypothetical protein
MSPTSSVPPDARAQQKDEWARLEYEEINRYGRTVYETIFRLAQMTFVINPALGAGFYYVFFEKRALLDEIGFVGLAVAILGMVYNLGAFGVYAQSHAFLEALLIRIRELDGTADTRLHIALEATAPYSYKRFWGTRADSKFDSADLLTKAFLLLLFIGWALASGYALYVRMFPRDKWYLLVIEVTIGTACVGTLLFAYLVRRARNRSSATAGTDSSPVSAA